MTQEWLDYLKALAAYQVDLLAWLSGGGVHTDTGSDGPPPPPPPKQPNQ